MSDLTFEPHDVRDDAQDGVTLSGESAIEGNNAWQGGENKPEGHEAWALSAGSGGDQKYDTKGGEGDDFFRD
ncbi:MAG TPA: hypothetical protein VFM96_12525 [Gaiellaceae bacterium]|nr:hypothetical protein [Gaiellaceae bacterium]